MSSHTVTKTTTATTSVEERIKVNTGMGYDTWSSLAAIKAQLREFMEDTGDGRREFEYRGYMCCVVYNREYGNFCGYLPALQELSKNMSLIIALETASKVHGGLTHSTGFDCANGDDLKVPVYYKTYEEYLATNRSIFQSSAQDGRPAKTFKSETFVAMELRRMVDCLIKLTDEKVGDKK